MSATEARQKRTEGMRVTPTVRLLAPLGAGGMGAVWLAEHTGLRTKVVVKFMHDELGESDNARSRFSREAMAAAQVRSPHVVHMLDHGVTDDGTPFIVMEHLEGRTLGAVLRETPVLPPGEVIAIVTQVARALARVHGEGLLHRDVKPENIFLCDSDGEPFVKLLDFGIVKSSRDGLDTQTKTGQVVGTPFYMSPEQMMGHKEIDARSDLWSLGVVGYECLTGQRPFDGPSFGAVAVNIATVAPMPPSEVRPGIPVAVDAWFQRACARLPEDRFASAKDLADALREALGEGAAIVSEAQAQEPREEPKADRALVATVVDGPTLVEAPSSLPREEIALARTEFGVEGGLLEKSTRSSLSLGVVVAAISLVVGAGVFALLFARSSGGDRQRPIRIEAAPGLASSTSSGPSTAAAKVSSGKAALQEVSGAPDESRSAKPSGEDDGGDPGEFLPLPVFVERDLDAAIPDAASAAEVHPAPEGSALPDGGPSLALPAAGARVDASVEAGTSDALKDAATKTW